MMGEAGSPAPGRDREAVRQVSVACLAEWDTAQTHHDWQKVSGIAPRKPDDRGWGRGKQPAIDVSWDDAKAYCKWLSAATSKAYRLPSEAEWEHACRAGTTTEFWWGNEISTAQANYDGNQTFGNGKKGEYRQRTVPVDSFEANPWGLYQVHGNVWEWCEDAIGSSSRVLRGGSWDYDPIPPLGLPRQHPAGQPRQLHRVPSCQNALTPFSFTSLHARPWSFPSKLVRFDCEKFGHYLSER